MDRWGLARRTVAVLDERVLHWLGWACRGTAVTAPILAWLDLISVGTMRALWLGAIFTYLILVAGGRKLHQAVDGRDWLDGLPPPNTTFDPKPFLRPPEPE